MTPTGPASPIPFVGAFVRLAVPGLVGVAALFPTLREFLRGLIERPGQRAGLPPGMSLDTLTALSLIQPTLLVLGAVALGLSLAPRVGLRSVIAGVGARSLSQGNLRSGGLAGVFSGAALVALDALTRPLLGEAGTALTLSRPRGLAETLAGVLYGGITEELLMRWGLMTALVWGGWRLFQRGQGSPRPGVLWTAILVSALMFGVGHLGAAGTLTDLTPPVVIRTVGLNALVGMVFGALYAWRNLETAMLAHATWHVTVTLLSLLLFSRV